jgi:hypothetical protein
MDKLESEGKYWNELLAGGLGIFVQRIDHPKLCNDAKYDKNYRILDLYHIYID